MIKKIPASAGIRPDHMKIRGLSGLCFLCRLGNGVLLRKMELLPVRPVGLIESVVAHLLDASGVFVGIEPGRVQLQNGQAGVETPGMIAFAPPE